jgi:hypothetical protein
LHFRRASIIAIPQVGSVMSFAGVREQVVLVWRCLLLLSAGWFCVLLLHFAYDDTVA